MATKKVAPAPIGQIGTGPVTPHSGGPSDVPSRTRVAAKYQPRPSVHFGSNGNPSKTGNGYGEGETTRQAPKGLSMPKAINRSGHDAGGDNDRPMRPRKEGTANRALNTIPSLKNASTSAEPDPMGLTMPEAIPHSGESIRSSSLGSKPMRWKERGYKHPTAVENLSGGE